RSEVTVTGVDAGGVYRKVIIPNLIHEAGRTGRREVSPGDQRIAGVVDDQRLPEASRIWTQELAGKFPRLPVSIGIEKRGLAGIPVMRRRGGPLTRGRRFKQRISGEVRGRLGFVPTL